LKWEHPQSQKEVQACMGFRNFYRCCIKDISKLTKTLTDTTSEQLKDKNSRWSDLCKKTFEELKQRVTTALVIWYYNPTLPITGEMDASNFTIGAVLS
jgi:hypothetical protein